MSYTYKELVDILKQQSPLEVVELLNLDGDVEELVAALADYIEEHQEDIEANLEENGLI